MGTRAEWKKRVKRSQSSGPDAEQFTRRELGSSVAPSAEPQSPPMGGVEPSAPPLPAPAAPAAPAWIDIPLPDGGLVRVLPGIEPATLACMLTVVTKLSR